LEIDGADMFRSDSVVETYFRAAGVVGFGGGNNIIIEEIVNNSLISGNGKNVGNGGISSLELGLFYSACVPSGKFS